MKPTHPFRHDLNAPRLPRHPARSDFPLIDVCYLTSNWGANSQGQSQPSAEGSRRKLAVGELQREMRHSFIVEAIVFLLITGLVMASFWFCAAALSEFLHAISLSPLPVSARDMVTGLSQ